jgi:hypothetical protein
MGLANRCYDNALRRDPGLKRSGPNERRCVGLDAGMGCYIDEPRDASTTVHEQPTHYTKA